MREDHKSGLCARRLLHISDFSVVHRDIGGVSAFAVVGGDLRRAVKVLFGRRCAFGQEDHVGARNVLSVEPNVC